MRRRRQHPLAVAIAALALCAAGCGGPDGRKKPPGPGFPAASVRSLNAELELLQERIDVTRDTRDPGSCGDVERKSYPAIDDILSRLPNDTDPDKLNALRDSVRRLRELADQECSLLAEEIRQEREQDQPEETVETAPPAVTTEATPPETTPTESTPEATAPETTPAPGNSGNEQGNGGGRGTGNGVTPPGQGGGLPAPDPDEDD